MGARLSTLWVFALFNYLYCDIVGLMDSGLLKQYLTGHVGGLDISSGFLLGAAVLMEIPIAMIVVSRLAGPRTARLLNLAAGVLMTVVQSATLFMGTPTTYYVFFSVIEIACTAYITWCAWKWHITEAQNAPLVAH
ncbi:DUF6326 family protein [Nonomuraea sp. NPDC050556]|uniref:DUF6326 family protein n=1 Tax=Nonomuraea sp. NPDC050556 TaxID=3364369 RepID=UPI003797F997